MCNNSFSYRSNLLQIPFRLQLNEQKVAQAFFVVYSPTQFLRVKNWKLVVLASHLRYDQRFIIGETSWHLLMFVFVVVQTVANTRRSRPGIVV